MYIRDVARRKGGKWLWERTKMILFPPTSGVPRLLELLRKKRLLKIGCSKTRNVSGETGMKGLMGLWVCTRVRVLS